MPAARQAHVGGDAVLNHLDVGRLHGDEGALIGITLHADDAAADRVITVEKDEATHAQVFRERVERQHGARAQHHLGHAVAFDPIRSQGRQIVGVDDALE